MDLKWWVLDSACRAIHQEQIKNVEIDTARDINPELMLCENVMLLYLHTFTSDCRSNTNCYKGSERTGALSLPLERIKIGILTIKTCSNIS